VNPKETWFLNEAQKLQKSLLQLLRKYEKPGFPITKYNNLQENPKETRFLNEAQKLQKSLLQLLRKYEKPGF
jgi:phosphorylcholine metabolism protein LicD